MVSDFHQFGVSSTVLVISTRALCMRDSMQFGPRNIETWSAGLCILRGRSPSAMPMPHKQYVQFIAPNMISVTVTVPTQKFSNILPSRHRFGTWSRSVEFDTDGFSEKCEIEPVFKGSGLMLSSSINGEVLNAEGLHLN
jgi:hypothetical protein